MWSITMAFISGYVIGALTFFAVAVLVNSEGKNHD